MLLLLLFRSFVRRAVKLFLTSFYWSWSWMAVMDGTEWIGEEDVGFGEGHCIVIATESFPFKTQTH